MKYIMYLLLLFLLMGIVISGCQKTKYPTGRDTFDSFGDGRFQIMRFGQMYLTLFDLETQSEIIHRVKDYSRDGEIVYALDENGTYTTLNFITGKFEHYKTLNEAPNDYRKHLAKLNKN